MKKVLDSVKSVSVITKSEFSQFDLGIRFSYDNEHPFCEWEAHLHIGFIFFTIHINILK